jgi:hypothetical protein
VTQYAAPVAERSKSRERKRERPTTLGSGWVVSRFWWGFALRWVGVGYMVALGGLWGCSQWWLGVLVELTEGIEGILLIGIHKRERRSFCRCLQPLCTPFREGTVGAALLLLRFTKSWGWQSTLILSCLVPTTGVSLRGSE